MSSTVRDNPERQRDELEFGGGLALIDDRGRHLLARADPPR
jgi:hypothetical protein